jgi:hypothetical protein
MLSGTLIRRPEGCIKVILQDSQKSIQKLQDHQKEFDKVVIDKDEEISHLKEHSQKLLAQIKKSKDKMQCNQNLEQENQDLKKKLSEKDEENSSLKKLNQKLLEQIKRLKDEKPESQKPKNKFDKSENDEELFLKNHNQSFLAQIKKLKDEKKTQPKLDQCVNKEPLVDKETMIDPVEVGISSNVEVQMMENPNISTNKHLMINKVTQVCKEDILPNVKQEGTTNMVRKEVYFVLDFG